MYKILHTCIAAIFISPFVNVQHITEWHDYMMQTLTILLASKLLFGKWFTLGNITSGFLLMGQQRQAEIRGASYFYHAPYMQQNITIYIHVGARANYFRPVRPLHALKCEQGRGVWVHAPPGKLGTLRSLLRPCLGQKSYILESSYL